MIAWRTNKSNRLYLALRYFPSTNISWMNNHKFHFPFSPDKVVLRRYLWVILWVILCYSEGTQVWSRSCEIVPQQIFLHFLCKNIFAWNNLKLMKKRQGWCGECWTNAPGQNSSKIVVLLMGLSLAIFVFSTINRKWMLWIKSGQWLVSSPVCLVS